MNFTKQLLYCFPVFDSVSPSILRLRRCFWCIGVFSAWSWSHPLWVVVIIHISEQQWFRNTAENMSRLTVNPSLHLQMTYPVLKQHLKGKNCFIKHLIHRKTGRKKQLWYVIVSKEGNQLFCENRWIIWKKTGCVKDRSLHFFAACHSKCWECKCIHHALHILSFVSQKAHRIR